MICSAKVRYRSPDEKCSVYPLEDGTVKVIFDVPVKAVTPGQTVAFYQGDICLGGGVIEVPMIHQL